MSDSRADYLALTKIEFDLACPKCGRRDPIGWFLPRGMACAHCQGVAKDWDYGKLAETKG